MVLEGSGAVQVGPPPKPPTVAPPVQPLSTTAGSDQVRWWLESWCCRTRFPWWTFSQWSGLKAAEKQVEFAAFKEYMVVTVCWWQRPVQSPCVFAEQITIIMRCVCGSISVNRPSPLHWRLPSSQQPSPTLFSTCPVKMKWFLFYLQIRTKPVVMNPVQEVFGFYFLYF